MVAGSHRHAVAAPAAPQTVVLNGEGSTDANGEVPTWKTDLFGSGEIGLIDLHYLSNSGYSGRQDFLAGGLDYILSGVPFTAKELAQLPHGGSDIVDAPVHVAAMGILGGPVRASQPFFGQQTLGVISWDSQENPTFNSYHGPIQLPAANLAAMLLHDTANPLEHWDNPSLRSAMGMTLNPSCDAPGHFDPDTGAFFSCDQFFPFPNDPSDSPIGALRSDPSETNYYFQQYIQLAAPTYWTALQHALRRTLDPNSESLQTLVGATRPSVEQQVDWFSTASSGGNLTPLPPYPKLSPKLSPGLQLGSWVQIQNGSGEWVQPTVAAINAAVHAGLNAPLYALTHPDATATPAYPLVWITHLYAPAHGLSVAKTEAMATTIRYLATAGQAAAASVGDGSLPDPLRAQALAAANQLVLSNCTGTGTSITSNSDPGPYAPASLAKQNIGPMLHCSTPAPPPATTTTSASTTTTTATFATAAPTGGSGVSSGDTGAANAATASTATPTIAPAGAATINASKQPRGPTGAAPPSALPPKKGALTVANLPLGLPWAGGGGWDNLSALALGALLYLAARKPLGALIKALRE
jgi:hypothetical protein